MALQSRSKLLRKDYHIYHVTQRNELKPGIFLEAAVASLFIKLLILNLKKEGIIVWNYSIMPSHYHLLVYAPNWRALAQAIQRVNTSFSQIYPQFLVNGRLFGTRPKYEPVTTQFSLLNLMAYVFRNPRKICYWKNYWKSGAWEYTFNQPTLTNPQGLEQRMGITIPQMMEIVDRTIDQDDQHLDLLAKVCQDHPVHVDLFKTVET